MDGHNVQKQRVLAADLPTTSLPAQAAPAILAGPDLMVPTLFHEPWWLDAATGCNWSEITVKADNRTVARWPLYKNRRWKMDTLALPPLTYSLGPALDEGVGSVNTRMLRRMDLTQALIEQLPDVEQIGLCLHRAVTDVLPFQAAGFTTAPQFTVEIAPQSEDQLWKNMRDKTRNVIRRCQERHTVMPIADPEWFVRFYVSNLELRQKVNYFPMQRLITIYQACAQRDRVQLIKISSHDGAPVGAAMMVFDDRRSYHLLTTRHPKALDNGITSLLVWEGIKAAASQGRIFDFDGIPTAGAARFYAGFGGVTTPRYVIRRASLRFKALHALRRAIKGDDRNYFAPVF